VSPAAEQPQIATLLECLPYIREFSGRTVVIKYGGAAMAEDGLREAFATDVVLLKYVGINPIVVHGGGAEITDYMDRLGLEVEFVQGLRVSNEQTVEVAKMVLVGKLNKDIVLRLNRHGQPAVGLCGDDGSLFEVRKQLVAGADGEARDLGYVGSIAHVDVDVLNHIAADYIPVVASVGADREGQSYNVNADEAAGAVAAALGAYKVVFMTDVEGWLQNPDDGATLISEVDVATVRKSLAAGDVGGGMLPKLKACADAVDGGVGYAHIVDGRKPHSLLLELFTHAGIGTKVRPADE
jgi:acetylglutamate kinase